MKNGRRGGGNGEEMGEKRGCAAAAGMKGGNGAELGPKWGRNPKECECGPKKGRNGPKKGQK